ncbi:PH domain-containing protein [Streptomyces sp. NPDC008313]|uniref:PH domain-containing protein n=1 Tax=Streptomyces sp. NPDC008313 TaxID=3364826 RepID=UPI0036E1684C
MTSPDHQSPAPEPAEPVTRDRVYRSPSGIAAGVLLLFITGWLGIDALVAGTGRTPWLALATLLLVVPLVGAFTLRPAVFANDDRLRVRNPLRVIVLPWASVASLRSGYSNEVVDTSGTKYQLWAVPVSLRARKKAAKRQTRGSARGGDTSTVLTEPERAQTDQIMGDLRELAETRGPAARSQGEPSVRWAYEILAPALAGAVLLGILLGVG